MKRMKNRGQLIVISGPSGCGKGSVIEKVLESTNLHLWLSISTTSRQVRDNDIPGKTYNFVTKENFEKKIKENYFLEYAEYSGNYYGTPKSTIEEKLENGIDVILEIEIQGALKIKEIRKDALFIFILPPSMRELKRRLEGRNTETKEKILRRFKTAYREINEVAKYNYVVINDEMEEASKKINSIIEAEKCRVDRIEETYLNSLEEEIHEILLEDNETI